MRVVLVLVVLLLVGCASVVVDRDKLLAQERKEARLGFWTTIVDVR